MVVEASVYCYCRGYDILINSCLSIVRSRPLFVLVEDIAKLPELEAEYCCLLSSFG